MAVHKVSDAIWADWHAGGSKRKTLEEIFKRCGYDPETFVVEVEIIKSEMESSEVVVEGEYMSTEKMEELGYSEQRIAAIKKHCRTNPQTLLRRDTYQKITLYYVETSVKGQFKRSSHLNMHKRARIHERGGLEGMTLGSTNLVGKAIQDGQRGAADGQAEGDAAELDLTKSDSDEGENDAVKLRKQLGVPEVDPDALPSSTVTKYLTAMAKRISKVAAIRTKFAESTAALTDIQTRLYEALGKSVTTLEDIHNQLATAYSQGVVDGFKKADEEAIKSLVSSAMSKAADSLALETRARPFVPKGKSEGNPGAPRGKAKAKASVRPRPDAKAKAKAKAKVETVSPRRVRKARA